MARRAIALLTASLVLLQGAWRSAGEQHVLTRESLNPQLLDTEYAVRGAVLDKADALARRLKEHPTDHGLPFSKIIPCNIGNPQALGQKPITFNRQVLSLLSNPPLLDMAEASPGGTLGGAFQPDAVRRARTYLSAVPEGVGAYSNSQGIEVVRQEVADFIGQRDGYPTSAADIFLTDGASAGVRSLYMAMIRPGKADGVLVPIPQYPLYSALTTLLGGKLVGYYLDEAANWKVTIAELKRALAKARGEGTNVRGLVVINPGNPTGQCLDETTMKEIVAFCVKEGLVLMADEVYQENVYAQGSKFTSFRKVALDMGAPAGSLELVSYHTISKGFVGECGIRGGYFELHNFDAGVKAELYKMASITLCSNLPGQFSTGLMVNPPVPGNESYATYIAERDGIISSLKRRASKLAAALNDLPGMSCTQPEGAMYLFPQVHVPPGAVAAAEKAGVPADTFYCIEMLEATGIVTVPGTGFKQQDGTFHFRTTFLPPEDAIDEVVSRLTTFHKAFMSKYGKTDL